MFKDTGTGCTNTPSCENCGKAKRFEAAKITSCWFYANIIHDLENPRKNFLDYDKIGKDIFSAIGQNCSNWKPGRAQPAKGKGK